MAERYAVVSGSIDTPANWDGGTLPDVGDDVYLNGRAMTAATGADITWLSLRNTAGTTAVAGGTLTISGARNFTITNIITGTTVVTGGMIVITAATGTVSITATVQHNPTTGSSSHGISKTGACNFIFNGGITATATVASAISITAAGTLTFGSVGTPLTLAAATTSSTLITINNASATGTIYADQFKGGAGNCLVVSASGNLNTYGTVYGGSASSRYGISITSAAGTITHVGDVYAGYGAVHLPVF